MSVESAITAARLAVAENADYDLGNGSTVKAEAYVAALRKLIVLFPAESGTRSSTQKYEVRAWQVEIEKAERWLEANATTAAPGRVTYPDFADFRGGF